MLRRGETTSFSSLVGVLGLATTYRILHIDDVPMNLQVMDHVLRALGHDPVGASCGAEAYALLETNAFDLVLTDLHMPDVTGLDFLKNVRAMRDEVRSTPVIVVTADVMSQPGLAYREQGFAGAVAKPVMAGALQRVIEAAMSQARTFLGEGFAREIR